MKTIQRNGRIFIGLAFSVFLTGMLLLAVTPVSAQQIYEPEGLNMPGGWNGWTNPPANNLALASYTQVTGGRVIKIATGIARWQTIFSVAASGGDLIGGTYEWLFTSGPSGSPWNNKWSNVNVTLNTLQLYTKEGGPNNTITITDGKWYTMNWEDNNYTDTRAIFMETSAQPVDIVTVSQPVSVDPGEPVTVTITTSQNPSPEEIFYLRYSTDGYVTSTTLTVSMVNSSGTAVIPGMPAGTNVNYYPFSSTVSPVTADFDLYSIKLNSNTGNNYFYTVSTPQPVITFANLQDPPTGTIESGAEFQVFGRAGIPGITGQPTQAPGLLAWVGYSSTNTDPSTWTNWIEAAFNGPVNDYDEFKANLGATLTTAGTYYYATRFKLDALDYVYGGYSAAGGGFWDGTTNISGVLTVELPTVPFFRTLDEITIGAEQTVCYDAKQTITVEDFVVMNEGSVTLIAGQNIIFMPGAIVNPGGYLLGYITTNGQYCATPEGAFPMHGQTARNDNEPEGSISCSIFPNPALSSINLLVHGIPEGSSATVEIFGVRGETRNLATLNGNGTHTISVSGFPAGVYYLRIVSGASVCTRMMVKQ
jgi:hypothetical protein